MLPFLVHKIFTFYINGVLNCKCPAPGPKGYIKKYIYSYLKCIVYDKLLKHRQSFRITLCLCPKHNVMTKIIQNLKTFQMEIPENNEYVTSAGIINTSAVFAPLTSLWFGNTFNSVSRQSLISFLVYDIFRWSTVCWLLLMWLSSCNYIVEWNHEWINDCKKKIQETLHSTLLLGCFYLFYRL